MTPIIVRQGDTFPVGYTKMLRRMFQESADASVLVLGDGEDADLPLKYGYTGWWAKMELFSPDLEDYRPFFYVDLDTYILGPVGDFMRADPLHLCLIRDFYNNKRSNSGVMLIPKDVDEIWANHYKWSTKNDGHFLNTQRHSVLQNYYPGIVSYKADDCEEEPKGRIVCFHGQPKPHNVDGWAGEVWKQYSS